MMSFILSNLRMGWVAYVLCGTLMLFLYSVHSIEIASKDRKLSKIEFKYSVCQERIETQNKAVLELKKQGDADMAAQLLADKRAHDYRLKYRAEEAKYNSLKVPEKCEDAVKWGVNQLAG